MAPSPTRGRAPKRCSTFSAVKKIKVFTPHPQYLMNYWGKTKKLIGFELGAPPHVQTRCSFSVLPQWSTRYDHLNFLLFPKRCQVTSISLFGARPQDLKSYTLQYISTPRKARNGRLQPPPTKNCFCVDEQMRPPDQYQMNVRDFFVICAESKEHGQV